MDAFATCHAKLHDFIFAREPTVPLLPSLTDQSQLGNTNSLKQALRAIFRGTRMQFSDIMYIGGNLNARDSRHRLFASGSGSGCDSTRQNVLVGGREIGAISKTGEAVCEMHGLAGGRYSRANQDVVRANKNSLTMSAFRSFTCPIKSGIQILISGRVRDTNPFKRDQGYL
jgi:hypothetical protein